MITQFIGRRQLANESLSERFDRDTIDSDDIMTRLLQRPKPFVKLLHQIYLHFIVLNTKLLVLLISRVIITPSGISVALAHGKPLK
jgi:hypothetical protein